MSIQAYSGFTAQSVARTSSYSANTTTNSNSGLSGDTFYKLLAAQLQNQDPMQSMDNTQMILQMAQFATIEQMNNLNAQFTTFMEMSSIQNGSNMVGKEVTVGTEDAEGNSTTVTGIVNKVGFTSSGPILQIDGKYYDMWRVITVSESTSTSNSTPVVTQPETSVEGETVESEVVDSVEDTPVVE